MIASGGTGRKNMRLYITQTRARRPIIIAQKRDDQDRLGMMTHVSLEDERQTRKLKR